MRISDWSSDVCSSDLFLLVFQLFELLGDLRQNQNAVVADEQFDEVASLSRKRRLDQTRKQLGTLGSVQPGIGQRLAHVALACHMSKLGHQIRPRRQDRKSTRLNSSH